MYTKGELIGADEEGQEIDVNKVSTALRTAGINLNEYLAGAKGLDDIFMELASKWDSLDDVQQRYIATMAAGSRQQSRFIAMMSNYSRTVELVDAANTSAGASNEQFSKTLDSLETKLARLKNAWDEFTMGIANSDLLKGAVDIITDIINAINKLTSVLPGPLNGLGKLAVAFGGMKAAKAVFTGFTSSLKGEGAAGGAAYAKAFVDEFAGINKIIQNKKIGSMITASLSGTTEIYASKGPDQIAKIMKAQETLLGSNFRGLSVDNYKQSVQDRLDSLETLASAQGKLQAAYQLTEGQVVKVQAAIKNGIPADIAATAAKSSNARVTQLLSLAEQDRLTIEQQIELAELTGHKLSLRTIAMKLGKAKASQTEAKGQALANLAYKEGLIVLGKYALIIGAAVLAIYLLVKAFQALKANTPEGRLETTKEAVESAGQAAEEAADSFDRLKSSIDGLPDKYNEINNLTRGTTEWKSAVADLNSEVLELIDKYPELAQFASMQDGVLTLNASSKGVQDVLSKYENQKYAVKATEQALQIQQKELEQQLMKPSNQNAIAGRRVEQMVDVIDGSDYTTARKELRVTYEGQDLKRTQQIAREIVQQGLKESEAKTRYGNEIDFNKTGVYESLIEFGRDLINTDSSLEIFKDSLIQNIIEASDVKDESKQYLNEYLKTVYDKKRAEEESKYSIEEAKKYWKEVYGEGIEVSATGAVKGTDRGDNEIDINANVAKTQYLANLTEQYVATAAQTAEAQLNNLTDEQRKALGGTSMLTKGDIKQLTADNNFTKLFDGDVEAAQNYIKSITDEVEAAFKNAEAKAKSIGLDSSIFENLTASAATSFANTMSNLFRDEGPKAMSQVMAKLNEYRDKDSDWTSSKAMEYLSTLDFSNAGDLKGIKEGFSALGIATDGIDEFIDALIEAAGATYKYSDSQYKSIYDMTNNLKNREANDLSFTAEEMKTLLESYGAERSDFAQIGPDEFVYLGGTMDNLIAAIEANTAAQLGENANDATTNFERAQKIEDVRNGEGLDRSFTGSVLSDMIETQTSYSPSAIIEAITNGTFKVGTGTGEEGEVALNLESAKQFAEAFNIDLEGATTWDAIATAIINAITSASDYFGSRQQAVDETTQKMAYETSYNRIQAANGQDNEVNTEGARNAIDADIATQAGLAQAYERAQQALEKQNEELSKNEYAIKQHVINERKDAQEIDKLNKVINDNADGLKDVTKKSAAYDKAISQITRAAKEVWGDVDGLNEVVKENADLFIDLAEGGEKGKQAFNEISKIMGNKFVASAEASDISVQQLITDMGGVEGAIQKLDNSSVDVVGYGNFSDIFNNLELTKENVDEVSKFIDALGFTLTVTGEIDGNGGKLEGIVSRKSFAGTGPVSPSGGGGGGGGGAAKEWENPYDWLYNLTQKINEELRTRERLERKYDMLLKNRQKSAKDIINNRKAELETLKQEQKLQEEMLSKRTEEGQHYMQENSDLLKYGKLVTDENGRVTVEIDWDLINTVKDEEEGKRIEDFISNLERIEGEIENAEDGLDDIEDRILEIYEQGKDEYFDLEDRIYDAVVNARQEEIDELSAINDTLIDTNQKIIDAMSKEIEKMRQDRENERTEQDIADKQQRLAYLQQDTSGANAMEIMKLQEEISNSQESYTDSLIDQKINELEDQNDKAAEQRQQQIDVLQTQLEHDQETGEIWKQVYSLWQTGIDSNGKLINNSNLEEILKNSENFDGLSEQSKMNWMGELETQMKAAVSYLAVGRSAKSLLTSGEISENDSITFTDIRNKDSQKTIKGKVDKDGNVIDSAGNIYSGVHQDETGRWVFDQSGNYKAYQAPTPKVEQKQEQQQQNTTNVQDTQPHGWKFTVNGALYNFTTSEADARANWNNFKEKRDKIEKQIRDAKNASMPANEKQMYLDYLNSQRITLSGITAYKTGGVADFTGPAWLDGTPSKPEIILNQKDSQNFIQLKNILATLMSGSKTTASENNGDNYYDVDINVEKLESDYDVEQVAEKVKSMIRRDATYRNVNVINNTR